MFALVDRHQADLLYALQRLFEDRLGIPLYTPVGHEWWDEGVWQFGAVFGDDRLARQYLVIDAKWRDMGDGLYLTFDPCHPERPLYGVTLERARQMEWRVVMATVQENQAGFARFAKEAGHRYSPPPGVVDWVRADDSILQAKYLYQVGNTRQQIDWSLDPICLNSTADVALTGRGALIAQEFDRDGAFRYRPPTDRRSVASFINLLPLIPDAWATYGDLRVRLPDWRFRNYGHSTEDGVLQPVAHLAEEMARTGWAFMDKVTGDGFGHVIHNWAAVGRPLVGHGRYYVGQRAAYFWRDLETCIDLDLHSADEAADLMRTMPDSQYEAMCRAIRDVVDGLDFAADAEKVRALL